MSKWYGIALSVMACCVFWGCNQIASTAKPQANAKDTPKQMQQLLAQENLLDQMVLQPYSKRYSTPQGTVLEVEASKPADGKWVDYEQAMLVDTKPYVGKRIMLECEISAEGVAKNPQQQFYGIKFMPTHTTAGVRSYPEGRVIRDGNYDWTWSGVMLEVPPENFDEVKLCLGLQQAYGKVRYRNLKLSVLPDGFKLDTPADYKCEYSDAVRNFPRLRGVMTPGHSKDLRHVRMTEKDIRDLAAWGANFVRWQYFPSETANPEIKDPKRYGELLDDDLKYLDSLLPVFKECGIWVLYDMHTVPGGRMRDNTVFPGSTDLAKYGKGTTAFHMFYNKEFVDCYLEQWRKIARHFKNEPQVIGYDLMNEPDQRAIVTYDFVQLQLIASQEIRKIDGEKPIVFESNYMDAPSPYRTQVPLPVKNIIYQVHMYTPGSFTHQGVNNSARFNADGSPITYPGILEKKNYDRNELKKVLDPVLKFQQKYGARIYVGEFSAIRWAKGADKYLEDCISIFEEFGWDWTYHAYREWDGWSVEHTEDINDKKPATYETARKKVLLRGLNNNKK
ncbi:MAG: cellulase family glycosylhydrolase [Victivallales bacterium]|nr:cellulase family glycosylhydrolase [Victivallales bacterium]